MPKLKHTARVAAAPPTPLKKKTKLVPITNPYSSSSSTAKNKYINHIDTARTLVEDFFISTATKYNKKQAFLYDFKKEFPKHDDWMITTFMSLRDPSKPASNEYLYEEGTDYTWTCIVCRSMSEDDTAVSIGTHLAKVFSDYNVEQHASQKPQMGSPFKFPPTKFDFRNDLTSSPPKPLNYYLTDGDAVKLLKQMYAEDNKKSTVMEKDDLLVKYFGSAELGREMLQMMSDDDWNMQDDVHEFEGPDGAAL